MDENNEQNNQNYSAEFVKVGERKRERETLAFRYFLLHEICNIIVSQNDHFHFEIRRKPIQSTVLVENTFLEYRRLF